MKSRCELDHPNAFVAIDADVAWPSEGRELSLHESRVAMGIPARSVMADLSKFCLNDVQMNKLESYSSLILKWNKRIQMTATKDLEEFVGRHVVDSLELALDIPEGEGRMLDVGSGGGLPGIVLAIARPDVRFTLIEPTQKKHAFLSTARRELSLGNLQTLPIRDEELIQRDDFERFDYAVARAVWAVDTWLQRGSSLVRPGGIVFAMEGREESELPEGSVRRRYQLSGQRERSIILLRVPEVEVG